MPRRIRKRRPIKPQVLSEQLCACLCGLRVTVNRNTKLPNRFRTGHQHRIYQPNRHYFHKRDYRPGAPVKEVS